MSEGAKTRLCLELDVDPDMELGMRQREEILSSIGSACSYDVLRVRISVLIKPSEKGFQIKTEDGVLDVKGTPDELETEEGAKMWGNTLATSFLTAMAGIIFGS